MGFFYRVQETLGAGVTDIFRLKKWKQDAYDRAIATLTLAVSANFTSAQLTIGNDIVMEWDSADTTLTNAAVARMVAVKVPAGAQVQLSVTMAGAGNAICELVFAT